VVVFFESPTSSDDGSDALPTTAQPPGAPVFTGSLGLYLKGGMRPIARRLLSLPSGIHFRKLALTSFCEEDLLLMAALVGECSHTLESLDISCHLMGTSTQHLLPQ
jgi:hypothetical protein